MPNKGLFQTRQRGRQVLPADTKNEAGGVAYSLPAKHALAQYAATGTFTRTFYASAEEQLDKVLDYAKQADALFLAKLAKYSRNSAFMKDSPAVLLAVLSQKDPALFRRVFFDVINTPKMLRTFVQVMRSGATGRRSFGYGPKRMVQRWINEATTWELIHASIGETGIADIIKMSHPRPVDAERKALYAYLIGKEHSFELLPELVQAYEQFRGDQTTEVPSVPNELLEGLNLTPEQRKTIARHQGWHWLRMNINTMGRYKLWEDKDFTSWYAGKLREAEIIKRSRVFPYQLLMSYIMTTDAPHEIREAIQDAMEIAVNNVPFIQGQMYVCPDVSGSMSTTPVTGFGNKPSKVMCVQVAALFSSAVIRANPSARVLPFDTEPHKIDINPRDSVMTNTQKLTINGGGTTVSVPVSYLNMVGLPADLVIIVSDNQSWADSSHSGTRLMREWEDFKRKNPKAKMICIDAQPYGTVQAPDRDDILHVGGFSDEVFNVINSFAMGDMNSDHWVGIIDAVEV